METTIKRTELNGWHRDQGANMANFGGYDMPLWYSSVKNEHLAVLNGAGVFDTSHMAAVTVAGSGAADLLQHCFTNDLDACMGPSKKPLSPGRCVYGAFLDENGQTIDDAIVFYVAADSYMVVINAGMGKAVADHLRHNLGGRNASITDLSDRLGKMDIQGPAAAKILGGVLADPQTVFTGMPYFSFKGHFDPASPLADAVRLDDGTPILLSRTGYTGEFGFEIFLAPNRIQALWERLLEAGRSYDIKPCGLAARDSLRAGAVLPLSHQDIGPWPFIHNPWPFALPYNADQTGFTKEFIGGRALLETAYQKYTLPFAGYDLRKVSTHDPAEVSDADDKPIGTVLTCATDMAIGRHENRIYSIGSPDKPENFQPRGLCCGFVNTSGRLVPGQTIFLKDKRRKIKVEIVDDIRPNRTARLALSKFLL